MRVHKDGYIQCRRLCLWVPDESYRYAIATGKYRNEGLEKEIERVLDVELSGELRFRVLEFKADTVYIQIDSDWVQPTRA